MIITSSTKVLENNLPIALALYINRNGVVEYPWDEIAIWRLISGDRHEPVITVKSAFRDAVAAFLMGEVGKYFGDWVSETLEQVGNCNNGKIVKQNDEIIKHRSFTVLSRDELDILIEQGFHPIGYKEQ